MSRAIRNVKEKFRNAYIDYKLRSSDLDCGAALAQTIRPELVALAENVNALAEQLKAIDPDFPKSWTPL